MQSTPIIVKRAFTPWDEPMPMLESSVRACYSFFPLAHGIWVRKSGSDMAPSSKFPCVGLFYHQVATIILFPTLNLSFQAENYYSGGEADVGNF